jgi:hypothetical protein
MKTTPSMTAAAGVFSDRPNARACADYEDIAEYAKVRLPGFRPGKAHERDRQRFQKKLSTTFSEAAHRLNREAVKKAAESRRVEADIEWGKTNHSGSMRAIIPCPRSTCLIMIVEGRVTPLTRAIGYRRLATWCSLIS